MVRGSVLPAAAPGIMTGIILAMARAIGEAAPLILIGAFAFVTFLPNPFRAATRCCRSRSSTGRAARRRLRGHRGGGDHRDPGPHARPQRARAHRPSAPLEAHPVVEENPVNTQLSEAPVREPDRWRRAVDPTSRPMARDDAAVRATRAAIRRRAPGRVVLLRLVPRGPQRRHQGREAAITALIGPSGCGKSTLLRTINRMNDLVPSYRIRGQDPARRPGPVRKVVDPVAVRRRVGMVFQKPNPFPKTVWENVAFGPEDQRLQGRPQRARGDEPPPGGPVGRRQGQAQAVRHGVVRRAAATLVHRPDHRGRSRGDPHGRAVLGPRSALHAPDRGADGRAQAGVHDRHRHPQHAAGRPRVGHDRVHDDGRRSRRLRRGEGADRRDLHEPEEPADRGLRLRSVR